MYQYQRSLWADTGTSPTSTWGSSTSWTFRHFSASPTWVIDFVAHHDGHKARESFRRSKARRSLEGQGRDVLRRRLCLEPDCAQDMCNAYSTLTKPRQFLLKSGILTGECRGTSTIDIRPRRPRDLVRLKAESLHIVLSCLSSQPQCLAFLPQNPHVDVVTKVRAGPIGEPVFNQFADLAPLSKA